MAVKVIMPILGLTMTHGKIARWLKSEGDKVKKGEPLLEIATEKIVTEVESPGEGTLVKIIQQENAVVPVTEMIGIIAAENEDYTDLLQEAALKDEPAVEPAPPISLDNNDLPAADPVSEKAGIVAVAAPVALPLAAKSGQGRLKISPLARKIASASGLSEANLRLISGSGPEGRIVKKDVEAYAADKPPQMVKPLAGQRASAIKPLSMLRSTIAERMSTSWETPHFYLETEVDVTNLLKTREDLNLSLKKDGLTLSLNDLLVKICAHALSKQPEMNASFSPEGITIHGDINLGVAVALDEGLIVPVVKQADLKSLVDISLESKDLVARAKAGKLTLAEISGGTFTLSNLGMFAIEAFTAIINPPEAAILSVGRVVKKAVVVEDEIVVKPMMRFNLGLDHRVLDGAQGARFNSTVKDLIENPYLLLT